TELVTEERIESRLEIEFEEKELELAAIRLSYNQMKSSVENQQQIQSKLEKNIHDAQRTLDITNNQIIVTKENIERVASDFNKKEAEKSKLNIELETNAAQKTEINTELESLKKIETERLLQIDQFMQSIKELDTLIIDCNRNLDAKQNEHDLLKNMVENLEGYPDSIKYLSNKITAPLLSDLLYVKQEYRVAIENYLENYLNYFVADHEEVALDAIQQLDKTNKGKANFFLLNHFNESSISTSTESEGNIRALDVIEFDAKYKHLFHYLFENVNIVEKITTLNGSNILIQRDAKVINDGKKLSGGSIGIFEGNKIGRKINLNRLVDEINILKKKQVELSDSMKVLKQEKDKLNLQSYNNKIQQLQVKLTQLNQNEAIISTKINSFQSQLGDITAQQSQLSARLNEFQDTYQKFELTINDLRKELESVTQNSFGQKEQFSKESQKIQAIQTEFNELNIKLIRQQGVVNNIKNNISFKNKQLEQNHTTLLENTEELKKISQSISLCEDGIISYANNLQNLYAEREKSQGFLSEFEQSFFKDRTRISNLEDEIRKTSRISQENIALVNQLKDKQNEIKYQVLNIADRLSVEFSIDINDVINTKLETQEVNEKELIVEIDKLKSKIDNFGEINPLAVEAYNEMKIRFDEIQSQKNDIDEARISLKETIDEIEQTATKLFLDAFNKVRENFQNVFRHLFSEEDSCDLILLDPEKPLESVIQITAKPKGKRPQSISQLSGGEKTLTATALLFSLYLLKPAPFCIFDEVDAPLDDANIEKFNKIIKEFSKESQFIIVTHNKQTMSAVDTIYGIYMQEQGVSAVSGVDFKSFKENGILESSPN
ncbi:MAG: chromosome segregation protein SMC, partial [Saprospiraceae bacterium]|nr:chromosome segregation protein SMC [Saprospiraceae bacterium]